MVSQPVTISQHWDNVAKLGCIISLSPMATIHHVHGGSMKDHGYHSGMAQRGISDALVIPLHEHYHTGGSGIDAGVGVLTWERQFGTQWMFLHEVSEALGYDLIELHEAWLVEPAKKGKRKR